MNFKKWSSFLAHPVLLTVDGPKSSENPLVACCVKRNTALSRRSVAVSFWTKGVCTVFVSSRRLMSELPACVRTTDTTDDVHDVNVRHDVHDVNVRQSRRVACTLRRLTDARC